MEARTSSPRLEVGDAYAEDGSSSDSGKTSVIAALTRSRTKVTPGRAHVAEPASIKIFQSIEGLDELAPAWDALVEKSGSPMQQYAWTRACAHALVPPEALRIVVVGGLGGPRAIAPLVRRSRWGQLEVLGARELHEPFDFLFADTAALDQLTNTVVALGLPLFLKRLAADSPVVAALKRAYRGRGLVICRPVSGHPWIPLHDGWTEPEGMFSARRRCDFRRANRAAASIGTLKCDLLSPTGEEMPDLFAEFMRVESAGWKGRQKTALASDELRRDFYERYLTAAAQQGLARVGVLRIGDRVAAMQLAVESHQRLWLLKVGYDEAFARCSPGTLLMLETIRYAASRSLSAYEFLGAAEPWTAMWTQLIRPCVSLRAYPFRLRSAVALAAQLTIKARHKLRFRSFGG